MILRTYHRSELCEEKLRNLRQVAKAARYSNANPNEMNWIFAIETPDKNVAAFAGLACYRGSWCLRVCVVHPKYRGQGLQQKLIRARVDFLQSKKVNKANVWVRPENTYSLNNLIEQGFRFVKEAPKIFNNNTHIKLRKIF